jgi:hypothetical protein
MRRDRDVVIAAALSDMKSLLVADQDLLEDDRLIKSAVNKSVNKLWGTELEYGALDTSDPAELLDQYVRDAYPSEQEDDHRGGGDE